MRKAPSPKTFDAICVESAVAAEKRDVFGEAHGDDEAVEGVSVMEWEGRNRIEVGGCDGHDLDSMLGGFPGREIHERKVEREFPGA